MEKKDLNIYFCENRLCEPLQSFGPAVRPHYLLNMVWKGKGIFQRGAELYHLQAGDMFLIQPGEMTYYEADEYEPWEYAWVGFDGKRALELLKNTTLLEKPVFSVTEERERFIRAFSGMVEIFGRQDYCQLELIGYFLQLLSPMVKRCQEDRDESHRKEYLERAKDYIQTNFIYDVRIQDLSRFVGIDRSYLYRLFMEYEKISPKQYLQQYRIQHAKEMMQNDRYSITEVAYSCGFCDTESFTYHFSQQEQMTPLEYQWKIHTKKESYGVIS